MINRVVSRLFNVDRKQQLIILIMLAVVIFSVGYKISNWRGDSGTPRQDEILVTSPEQGNRQIRVHVSGAVEKPGVYQFSLGDRVQDAVEKAVSLPQADIQGLNLAAPLKDGQKLVVPLRQEHPQELSQAGSEGAKNTLSSKPGKTASSGKTAKLNINRASAKELEELPGLGPALVQRIITYRESQGVFTSEEDIKNVQGIGDKIYDKIKELITVNG